MPWLRLKIELVTALTLAEVRAKVHTVAYGEVLADSRLMDIIYSIEPSHRLRHVTKSMPAPTRILSVRISCLDVGHEGGLYSLLAVAGLLPTIHSSDAFHKSFHARCCGVRTSVDRYSDRGQRVGRCW